MPSTCARSDSSCARQAAPPWNASAEYKLFGHSSIQSRSASPPRRVNASRISRPYFSVTTFQPTAAEDRVHPLEDAVGDDGVQALPVVIDHPPDVADVVLPAFVAAPRRRCLRRTRHRRASAIIRPAGDRPAPSSLVRRYSCTSAAKLVSATPRPTEPVEKSTSSASLVRDGIRLRAAERAEPFELLARLAPEQVLDRVEDRAGVRLDRDAVPGPQDVEVERRHQRDDRRRRRLMASDFQAIELRPDVVRVMDHPDGEPQHLLFDRVQRGQPRAIRRRWPEQDSPGQAASWGTSQAGLKAGTTAVAASTMPRASACAPRQSTRNPRR